MAHPDDDQIVNGHLNEGTVHAWLDGQLPADQAARVESHVATCGACQAQVAEARGFIAASSRILTALDGVPARVVPERRHGVRLWHVRAAAAVLIVALGTATVLHEAHAPGLNSSRPLTLSDSQRLVTAPAAVNEVEQTVAPSAAPQSAAALSKKPAVREEARAPVASKTAPRHAGERDELKGAMQGAVPGAPTIVGGMASTVQPRRLDEGASARNSVMASDSEAASRPSPTALAVAPPAAERDIAAKVADADRKGVQKGAADTSALGPSRLAGLSASACVGRTVTVASGVTDRNGQVAMATVQLEPAPSTDSRFSGFALGTVVDSSHAAGGWTPLGRDSAIVSLPVQGSDAVSQGRSGMAGAVAPDTLRDQQVVRRRVRCAPQ